MPMRWKLVLLVIGLGSLTALFFKVNQRPGPRRVGVARADVTPESPVRLGGYGGRPGPHTGVAQRLWAKALAIDGGGSPPALWLTLDSGGLAHDVWLELRTRIHRRTQVAPERIVLTISHTHTAPATTGWAPLIQPEGLAAAEEEAMADYTRRVLDALEAVSVDALASMAPAELSWTQGSAGFAANRRTPGGPTDHALPALVAQAEDGSVRAIMASYACHCTTCGGGMMQVCGD